MSLNVRNSSNKAGFTLSELLVVMTLFVIISVGMMTMYSAQFRLSKNEISLTDAQAKVKAVINAVLPYVASANNILTSTVINSVTYTSDTDTLVVSLPTVDNSDEVVEGQSDIVVYNLSGTDLVRIIDAQASSKRTDGTKTLLSELDDLDFVYEVEANPAQSTWVNITLTKQVATYNDVNTIDVSNRVFLKNKE